MKPLKTATNVDRAKLLFELFPDQIPDFVRFAKDLTNKQLNSDLNKQRETWVNGLITFDFWIALFEELQKVFKRYDSQLHKSKNLFSDQLFDGYLAFVTTTLLSEYTKECGNKKFNLAIDLLFTF